MDQLDAAVEAAAERAFVVLERLVAEPSTIGQEQGAEEVLAAELAGAGFAIDRLAIPDDIGAEASSGIPRVSYSDRYDLIGTRAGGEAEAGRSLLINGHIDVVPADDASRWSTPPFEPLRRDGWLIGRGAGDMKCGFAAGLLAIWALDEIDPGWQRGPLTVVAAIEEEATGNGTLAAGRAGYLADAALLLEPTDLEILLGGISLIWVRIELVGRAGHAEAALESVNPIEALAPIIRALKDLETDFNVEHATGVNADAAFAAIAHPYNVNIGKVHAGDWASSVPATAAIEVRVGHPAHLSADGALERVRDAVLAATASTEWYLEHPPSFALTGYRAERYLQDADADIVRVLATAHRGLHGVPPELVTIGSTTDARYYLNQFGVPAVAYGPRTRNMHGTDEAVELASIVECAKVVARFLRNWYSTGEDGA
ncbi:ArgE/DapE family deacylase [soil metagenome]